MLISTVLHKPWNISPLRRRTEREVQRDSCDKVHIVFTEGGDIHVLCVIVSFETARRRVVQTSSRVMCYRKKDVCSQTLVSRNSSENSSFFTGCLMMTGIECWESHECNKPGHLRKRTAVCARNAFRERKQAQRQES